MSSFYISTDNVSKSLERVASVGVVLKNGRFLLMGKRRDSGKWTLPGGHTESGESPKTGAKRELWEEAGIKAESLKNIGTKVVTGDGGKKISVTAFLYEVEDKPTPTTKNDPDKEVVKWEWIDIKNGVPKEILENLHSAKNVVLGQMGLQKSLGEIMEKISKGGYGSGRKVETETHWDASQLSHSKDSVFYVSDKRKVLKERVLRDKLKEKEKEEYNRALRAFGHKSVVYTIDIKKGAPHKYIRKYRRGGNWVYVYKEPTGRTRNIDEDAIVMIKRMAELGDPKAKEIINSGMQEYPVEKLHMLRKMSDLGDKSAERFLEEMGINRKQERVEEDLVPSLRTEHLGKHQQVLSPEAQSKFDQAVREGTEEVAARLWRKYRDAEIAIKARKALGSVDDAEEDAKTKFLDASKGDTIESRLNNLNKLLIKMDNEMAGVRSSNSDSTSAGGYANLIWQKTIKKLSSHGVLPNRYLEAVPRSPGQEVTIADPERVEEAIRAAEKAAEERAAEERRRAAEIEAERAERERLALEGSMAYHMTSLMSIGSEEDKINKAIRLNDALKKMFGKEMKKEDWPYDFSSHGIDVTITSLSIYDSEISMEFGAKVDGEQIIDRWGRRWEGKSSVAGGRGFGIYNAILKVKSQHRGRSTIGSLINMSQIDFIRAHDLEKGSVTVSAALNVGGYNWTNQGFAFEDESSLISFRSGFKKFLKEKAGIQLSEEDMKQFKLPCHFSSFHDGKFYEGVEYAPLNAKQKQFRNIEGRADGTHTLTDEEISNSRTNRFHLGKAYLLGKSWRGVIRAKNMVAGNEQYEHFMNYNQRKLEAWRYLNPSYKNVVDEARSGLRARPPEPTPEPTPAPAPTPTPTRSASTPPSGSSTANRFIERLSRGDSSIVITEARLRRMARVFSDRDWEHFISNARLSPNGKARCIAKRQEMRSIRGEDYGR